MYVCSFNIFAEFYLLLLPMIYVYLLFSFASLSYYDKILHYVLIFTQLAKIRMPLSVRARQKSFLLIVVTETRRDHVVKHLFACLRQRLLINWVERNFCVFVKSCSLKSWVVGKQVKWVTFCTRFIIAAWSFKIILRSHMNMYPLLPYLSRLHSNQADG